MSPDMGSKAKKNISKFPGIYGDRLGTIAEGDIYSERLETRSATFGWDISPHLHPGLFQVFFIENGTFDFFQAEQQSQFSAPCLLLIPPTVLHGFEFNDQVSGRILSIRESYFSDLTGQITDSSLANQITVITQFSGICSAPVILECIKAIDRECSALQPEKLVMLNAYIQQLMVMIYRLALQNQPVSTEKGSSASKHYSKFMKLLRKNGNKSSITSLAAQLNMTPIHLNRICKSIAGKTAGQIQDEYLISEAKKYLSYTGHSVSEIAYLLHFEYPNYFARFFKKHTGQNPKAYRSKI
jgi:AraC family transcriptional activator of pobA